MKPLVLSAALFWGASVSAQQTTCQIEQDESELVQNVAWDLTKGTATMTFVGEEVKGKVSSVRSHNDGLKVNMEFYRGDNPAMYDLAEVAVFSTYGSHRMILVSFNVDKDGSRHVNSIYGSLEARCDALESNP